MNKIDKKVEGLNTISHDTYDVIGSASGYSIIRRLEDGSIKNLVNENIETKKEVLRILEVLKEYALSENF